MLKRVISLLLSMAMVLSLMPMNITASAEEIPAEETATEETVAPVAEESVPAETEAEETASDAPTVTEEVQTEYAETYDAGTTASGTCGDNLTWTLDSGVLTVSGTGAMDACYPTPWEAYIPQIQKAVIEEGVTTLGSGSFNWCSEMEEIVLPESLTAIDGEVFFGCSGLKEIHIPKNVTVIGADGRTFAECTALTGIWVDEANSTFTSDENGVLYSKDMTTLIAVPKTINREFVIPERVTSIAYGAFWSCANTTAVKFVADAPSINSQAFVDMTATVSYPAGNETWTEEVRQNYGGNLTWVVYGTGPAVIASGTCGDNLTWTLREDGILTVSGTGAMADYAAASDAPWYTNRIKIKKIVIENGITTIGDRAFDSYAAPTEVSIGDTVTSIGANAFFGCSSLTSVVIPDSVTSIGDWVFANCSSLTEIVIPESVTSINAYAFYGCSSLTQITIHDSVTGMGKYAFYKCSSLTSIVIPDSVTKIDDYAFQNCSNLKEIYFCGDAPSLESSSFIFVDATAYYPAGNETWTEEVRKNYGGTITWEAYEPEVEEEKILFAAWDDFSGYLYDFPDLPVNMMTMLVFCFGSEDEYVVLSDNLTAGGCITMSPGATVNGNQTWDIWPTEMGPGTVTYTDPDTGKTYTFDFVVTEAWEGGEGPGGEGPDGEVDDSVIRLFTRWDDASGFMESSEIRLDCTSPFVFCFGTYEDHIYVTDLELSGVATLSEQYTTEDGAPGYHLGVSGLGEGFVKYTHTDGVEYTYSVNGILGYPGDLIAVCTDPNRGYDGLEFVPYLTVGESLEAEFAVLDSMTTYRMLPAGTVYTTEGTATLEQVDGTVYAIGVSGEGEGMIHYTEGDQSGYMYVWGNAAGEGPDGGQGYPGIQNVQYQGQTISVFIGDVWDDELHDIQGYGDSYGARSYHDFRFRFLLGAFSGFESNREALAPAGFYDCISGITFHLEDTRNEFGSSEKRNCWLSNGPEGPWQDCRSIEPAVYENETLGIRSAQTYLRAEAGKGFYATVCMTFTYDDPSDDIEAATYTVKINGSYTSSGDVILDLSTGEHAALVDTAEELNGIVGDYDALLSWMEENFPDTFAEYKPGGTVTLNLPAVEYEDILTVDAKPDYDHIIGTYICLHGSTDENGKRTRLPGILAKAGLHEIVDIDFVYDPDVTYGNILGNNKELSYGILADCSQGSENTPEDVDAYWNDICNVGNCTFTGFDYGMLSTEYGYAGPAWGCTFNDCYYGIYMDCKDKGAGGNDNFSGNTFNGSKFAVCLRSLPGGSTPYSMRFHDNMFLKCHKEFKVTTSGNKHYFYFYRNYYSGAYHDGLMLLSEEESTGRAAQVELVDENGVQSTAVVLTDPCRIDPNMSVEDGLWIFGESTSILNAEADKLLIAQSALNDTRIAVLDSNEEEIALWDFGEAAQTSSVYTLRENSFNAGVSISETEEGSILVTVSNDDQTDAVLQSCAPMLEVDCPFESAYVLYGDAVILSELADGKIRFEAARGGEYVIVSGQPDAEFAATVGSVCYERVSEALAAAQGGETVTLLADSAERDVIVKEGINLDLNGYTLTADYVFAVKGSNIVDNSADNTGLLMVDAACVMISKTNSQLPVWNGEGYLFTTVKYRRRLEGYDADSLRYAFLPIFQKGATALLEDGVEGNKVTIEVRVSWKTGMAREYRNLVFNEDQVQSIVGTEGAFTLTFSGFSKLDMQSGITVEALVVSETGVSRISNAYVVDVTQAE